MRRMREREREIHLVPLRSRLWQTFPGERGSRQLRGWKRRAKLGWRSKLHQRRLDVFGLKIRPMNSCCSAGRATFRRWKALFWPYYERLWTTALFLFGWSVSSDQIGFSVYTVYPSHEWCNDGGLGKNESNKSFGFSWLSSWRDSIAHRDVRFSRNN